MKKCVKIGEGVYGEVFKTINKYKQGVALKVHNKQYITVLYVSLRIQPSHFGYRFQTPKNCRSETAVFANYSITAVKHFSS